MSSKIGVEERRAHQRRSINLDLQGTHGEQGVVARMVARNLSAGGLYCTSSQDFPEMTRLAVRLMLPVDGETRPVDLEAVVVRREEFNNHGGEPRYEFALYFTNVAETTRRQLEAYLADS